MDEMRKVPRAALRSLRDEVIWDESVRSRGEHAAGVISHQWVCLNVEIAKHLVRAPTADEADDVGIHLGKKERRRTSGAKATGRDLGREETEARAQGCDGLTDAIGEVRCVNLVGGVKHPRKGW